FAGHALRGPYTLSLHDALPISRINRAMTKLVGESACRWAQLGAELRDPSNAGPRQTPVPEAPVAPGNSRDDAHEKPMRLKSRRLDRKSTRLNSSHVKISYAVFC